MPLQSINRGVWIHKTGSLIGPTNPLLSAVTVIGSPRWMTERGLSHPPSILDALNREILMTGLGTLCVQNAFSSTAPWPLPLLKPNNQHTQIISYKHQKVYHFEWLLHKYFACDWLMSLGKKERTKAYALVLVFILQTVWKRLWAEPHLSNQHNTSSNFVRHNRINIAKLARLKQSKFSCIPFSGPIIKNNSKEAFKLFNVEDVYPWN